MNHKIGASFFTVNLKSDERLFISGLARFCSFVSPTSPPSSFKVKTDVSVYEFALILE
jgi:hypothetical protein